MESRGAALLLALLTLVGLSAVALTAFALAQAERAASQSALARLQARAAADAAIADALQGWPAGFTPSAPGEEAELVSLSVPGPADGTATLRSLGGPVFAIRGQGIRRDQAGNAMGFAELELVLLLDSAGSDSITRPRLYPRGLRILP
ncbi:MAG: hypothetical protein ACT4PM_00080 [Gemmatimonadales bacterium]